MTGDGLEGGGLVTIVVPLYNGGRFISETLRSILRQTYRRLEVIVIDDGSTDDGPEIVRRFADDSRVSLVMTPHSGIARTRNEGAARARVESEFLVFMDQDDLWDDDVLETLVRVLESRPDASGAFVLADFIDAQGAPLHPGVFAGQMRSRQELSGDRLVLRHPAADVELEHVFLNNPVYPPSCLLIRRVGFERLEGFDARFLVADDWDLVIRLTRLGPLIPVDEVKAGYRRHSANASGDTARNVRETRRIWATAAHSPANSPAQSARLHAVWRAHQARTSSRKITEGRELLVSGHPLRGTARMIDGALHRFLLRPPRIWARDDSIG